MILGTNCDDVDHCSFNPCQNNAPCHDFDDTSGLTYNCTCPTGFSDVNCSTENECVTQNVTCANEGVCFDLEGNFTCVNCTAG